MLGLGRSKLGEWNVTPTIGRKEAGQEWCPIGMHLCKAFRSYS